MLDNVDHLSCGIRIRHKTLIGHRSELSKRLDKLENDIIWYIRTVVLE
jgi:hypothetical protein